MKTKMIDLGGRCSRTSDRGIELSIVAIVRNVFSQLITFFLWFLAIFQYRYRRV